jgi:hypothetical protein
MDKTKQIFRHQLPADAQGDKEIKKYRAKFYHDRLSKERARHGPLLASLAPPARMQQQSKRNTPPEALFAIET